MKQDFKEIEIILSTHEDIIVIPHNHIIQCIIHDIKKAIYTYPAYTKENSYMAEYEFADKFEIRIDKNWCDMHTINYNADKIDNEMTKGKIKNMTYTQRLKEYEDVIGITFVFADNTKRRINVTKGEHFEKVEIYNNVLYIIINKDK